MVGMGVDHARQTNQDLLDGIPESERDVAGARPLRLSPLNAGLSADIAVNLSAHSALVCDGVRRIASPANSSSPFRSRARSAHGMPLSSTSVPSRTNSPRPYS